MRRVHWAATARHGELMVRQEESVTTPEATIILDQRLQAFSRGAFSAGTTSSARHPFGGPRGADGYRSGHGGAAAGDGRELLTSDAFEWAVTAAVSIGAHLAERNYALRFLDATGEPAFRNSPSAPEPEAEEYLGAAGLQSIAESLAAIQLTGPHPNRRDETAGAAPRLPGRRYPSAPEAGPQPFDDRLLDKLAAHRMRGPVLAILGHLTPAEAQVTGPGGRLCGKRVCTGDHRPCRAAPGSARNPPARRLADSAGLPLDAAARSVDGLRRGRCHVTAGHCR